MAPVISGMFKRQAVSDLLLGLAAGSFFTGYYYFYVHSPYITGRKAKLDNLRTISSMPADEAAKYFTKEERIAAAKRISFPE
ncbi:hypothetical protein V1511DRAFT_509848 [Dipodascopsis uninucleata]